jgi:hypothetical protein
MGGFVTLHDKEICDYITHWKDNHKIKLIAVSFNFTWMILKLSNATNWENCTIKHNSSFCATYYRFRFSGRDLLHKKPTYLESSLQLIFNYSISGEVRMFYIQFIWQCYIFLGFLVPNLASDDAFMGSRKIYVVATKANLSICLIYQALSHEDIFWHYTELGRQLHAPAALPPG